MNIKGHLSTPLICFGLLKLHFADINGKISLTPIHRIGRCSICTAKIQYGFGIKGQMINKYRAETIPTFYLDSSLR